MTVTAWTLDGEQVALVLSTDVYPQPAILRAAYKFTDRAYFYLAPDPDDISGLIAVITAKETTTSLSALVGDFENELLDQALRSRIREEFGPVQKLITEQAFAEVNLLDTAEQDEDYRADPRGTTQRR